jgi:SpoVK/Ycf46/Vps4 family AAA+-type ATPase
LLGWYGTEATDAVVSAEEQVETLDVKTLPDKDARRRYAALVGLDDQKSRLVKQLSIIYKPSLLRHWVTRHGNERLERAINERPPLFVLAGDVGSGKTELAETVGDMVSRELDIGIHLYRLSLNARGSGLVGDMTRLIIAAFERVKSDASAWRSSGGDARSGAILFIDEADSLAQSRSSDQMHHEDRVGVNAVIRSLNDLTAARAPVAVIMATNRGRALDPGVARRAADILEFGRPSADHRRLLLSDALAPQLNQQDIEKLVAGTGPINGRDYGYAFSDITQRLIPNIALAAYPDHAVDLQLAQVVLQRTSPTAPFEGA